MNAPQRLRGCVVLLNGFPGTGKFSIAHALQSLLEHKTIPTRFLDNHLTIDVAEAVHPGRGPEHKILRNRLLQAVFEDLKTLPGEDTVIIMTACLGANPEDTAVFAEHVAIAQYRGVPLYSFTICVEQNEHFRRLQSPSTTWGEKRKLADPTVLEDMLKEHTMLDPTDGDVARGIEMHHSNLHTTNMSILDSANQILDAILPLGRR